MTIWTRIESQALLDKDTFNVRASYSFTQLDNSVVNDIANLTVPVFTPGTAMRANSAFRSALSTYLNSRYGFTTTLADVITFSSRGNIEHVLVNFGVGDTSVIVTVSAPWVTVQSKITCYPSALDTPDHESEEAAVEGVNAYAANLVPGVGFDIIAWTPQGTFGQYYIDAVGA